MSIASEITRLQGVKSDILQAISDKGVTVPVGSALDDCPGLIASISGGGGGGVPYLKNIMATTGVKVVDENGNIGGSFLIPRYSETQYYNNFAIVIPGADYSHEELGQVTFVDTTATIGGRTYRTVTIAGVTWLAENLDLKFDGCDIGPEETPSTPSAWYYNNDEATYGIDGTRKCGLIYNWHAVKHLNDNRSTLCPGWHVPSYDEWQVLANAVGGELTAGTRLKALDNSATSGFPSGWGGTDDYGFGVLPAGGYGGSFSSLGSNAFYWTSTLKDYESAYRWRFSTSSQIDNSNVELFYGLSLRLVKDA